MEATPVLAAHFRELAAQDRKFQLDAVSADLFVPEPGEILLFDDGPAPAAVLAFSSDEREPLQALVRDGAFRQWAVQLPQDLCAGVSMSFDLFRTFPFPIAGSDAIMPRTAGLSFLVRYYGPMPDVAGFQNFYTNNHPPILGRLPAIRNVFCYLPEDFDLNALQRSKVMLINEVVFDDLKSLNRALDSDVVPALRADSVRFPPFGHSTHHAMIRETLFSKAAD
ncbi:hypothetical protein [Denitrobaculum tricleocarpae]|uniref:EthD domain-containing protein n=1 Tax=Denitrobaculum tricleocarpae TaxID=2591009 RepID=A0A545TY31_9PROT|nr:hypothetical protein [Denitrobaculum tricleocarpae]TQV82091.1 hypothetical protein FKG95_07645 [Denitrobaculum tricleocarpae]